MSKRAEVDIKLTEDTYRYLKSLTDGTPVKLEHLYCTDIVKSDDGLYGIFWFKRLFQRDDTYYVHAELLCPLLETHDEAVQIINGLANHLRENGIRVIQENN